MAIIAAVDNSDRAKEIVRQADRLATVFDETIHVIHVIPSSKVEDKGRAASNINNSTSVRDDAANIAADAVPNIESPYETIGLIGNPANRIVDYADEKDGRYIVVATRKRSPTGKAVFGSVSQSILLNANKPVVSTVVQPGD